MQREYPCSDCGKTCLQPIYVRLHLTAVRYRSTSNLPRWQHSIPLGHFCEKCLLLRVRTALGRDFDLSQAKRQPRTANVSLGPRTQEASS
jgi:hypothetical protein